MPADQQSSDDAFWATRGRAIQAYAEVEHSLFRLFAYLTGMELEIAAIIFFKIVNASTLFGIIEKLLAAKLDDEYATFSATLFKQLYQLSEARNRIVHWIVATQWAEDDETPRHQLIPGNVYTGGGWSPLTIDDVIDFWRKCEFVSRTCYIFLRTIDQTMNHPTDGLTRQTWREIFLQPIAYPPPLGHPLDPMTPEPSDQPPPSEE
jgi:hypothetical protein